MVSDIHTHAVYKVFQLSLISASYFGGHSVTHDFGLHDDVLIMVYSGSSLELSPEKKLISSLPKNSFLETVRRLLVYLPTRMYDSHRLP